MDDAAANLQSTGIPGEGMKSVQAQRWVRAVALFDLAATAPMAVPVLGDWYVAWLFSGFGVNDVAAVAQSWPSSAAVFVALTGILGILWNGCRLRHPEFKPLVRFDVGGRCAVAAVLLYFVFVRGAPGVLWLFVFSELAGALIELAALRHQD